VVAVRSGHRSSFRDPDGSLHLTSSKVFRAVSSGAVPGLTEFLATSAARELTQTEKLIETWAIPEREAERFQLDRLPSGGTEGSLFEHPRVWFASYAYEWPPEMLHAAGVLTLELCDAALNEGFGLKDATPFNVLFRGPNPIFIDILSFEKRNPGDPRWLPYEQFMRSFVLPLLLSKEFGLRADEIFISHGDGLQPEEVYTRLSWLQRLRAPFLGSVSIPAWLTKRVNPDDKKLYNSGRLESPEKAKFILEMRFRKARRLLRRAKPRKERSSVWSSYLNELSYSSDEFNRKSELVRKWTGDLKPQAVLDVGCNTGHFSEIAARSGSKVVAIDVDSVVVGRTWQRATERVLNILPLVVNLARPTPPVGWRNAEYASFLERAAGSFDMVMMLAVLHHLLVTERIPLVEILEVVSHLTKRYLVIEYVSREDPMFERLTRGRERLHAHFSQELFEAACSRQFILMEKHSVKRDLRWLYLLQKKDG
jgi:SAM-dependent methyltransferase